MVTPDDAHSSRPLRICNFLRDFPEQPIPHDRVLRSVFIAF